MNSLLILFATVHNFLLQSNSVNYLSFFFFFFKTPNTSPACMVCCLSLLTGTLGAFVCVGLLTEESACRTPLFQKAKVRYCVKKKKKSYVSQTFLTQRLLRCLQRVAQDFSEYITSTKTKLNEDETLSTLKSLMNLCSESIGAENKVSSLSSRSLWRQEIQDLLSACIKLLSA